MARIKPEDPPELLAEIPHQQFYNLVDSDVRRRLEPKVLEKFFHPSVAPRWYMVLRQMRATVDGTIQAKELELQVALAPLQVQLDNTRDPKTAATVKRRIAEITLEHSEWKLKTVRFRTGIEERIGDAEWARYRAAQLPIGAMEERAALLIQLRAVEDRCALLEQAILLHRTTVQELDDDDDGEDADEALWATLDDAGPPVAEALRSTVAEFRRLIR